MSPTSAETIDVVVVGAGPAGMAAAAKACAAGCAVTVIDAYPAPGGQFHRRTAPGLDRRRSAAGAVDSPGSATVTAFAELVAAGRIAVRSATTIWTAAVEDGPSPFRLHLTGPGAPPDPARAGGSSERGSVIRARSVVLATGATDRVLPFPGWDLPGVLTAGGAQALLKGQGVRAGERAVVGGSGPFLLPVAAALVEAGTEVAEVVEAQPLARLLGRAPRSWAARDKVVEAAGYAASLARHRVAFRSRSAVTEAAGDGRVEQVTVSRLDRDWSPVPGSARTIAVDAACVSFGFVPQIALGALLGCSLGRDPVWGDPVVAADADQATTTAGVFAAGEITGVAGAEAAAVEGAIAGLAAAAALGRLDDAQLRARTAELRQARARHRRFAAALGRMYERGTGWLDWLREDTVVCRCEEVEHGAVRRAVTELAASDLRSVKMTTRCGMGYCQGRMCGEAVAAIVAREAGGAPTDAGALSTPPVLVPVALAEVAALAEGDPAGSPTAG